MKVTTIRFYILNVVAFIKYFEQSPPPHNRVKSVHLKVALRTLSKAVHEVSRELVLHQIQVKKAKMSRIMPLGCLAQCQEKAKIIIPKLLGKYLLPLCYCLSVCAVTSQVGQQR